mgnify:CR=1 FL=1|uniref:Histidinol-phosphate transaminase n=1 Tax=Candidatus Methanomethylicus mesodigestus TaxID=1867258 RepID=A0A7C3J3Y5_9CREN
MDPSGMIDPEIRELLSVRKGKEAYSDASEASTLRMSLNENMLVDRSFSSTMLIEAARAVDPRAYPRPKGALALKAIAEKYDIWEDQIAVGNGSDELLELIMKVFVGRGEALTVEPTFEMYSFYVGLMRGKASPVYLRGDFSLDADAVLSRVGDDTKAIIICSPNNPTGRQFAKDEVLKIVKEADRLVVVDEAYADFAPYSLVDEAVKYQNLLVLRTFSKAYGLAGLRIGYCVGDHELIEWIRAAQSPFSVNAIAQEQVRAVLSNKEIYDIFVRKVVEERGYLMAEFEMINGVQPFHSDANFILFRILDAKKNSSDVARTLRDKGIEIRDRGGLPMLENCLRVTVSTRENNQKFVRALREIVEGD